MSEPDGMTATAGPAPGRTRRAERAERAGRTEQAEQAGRAGRRRPATAPAAVAALSWHRRKWQQASKIERVDAYSHLTLTSLPWFLLVCWSGLLAVATVLLDKHGRGALPLTLTALILAINTVQCRLCNRDTRAAVEHYLGRGEISRRQLLPPALLMCAGLAVEVVFQRAEGNALSNIAMFLLFTPIPLLMPYSTVVPVRTYVHHCLLGIALVTLALALAGVRGGGLLTAPLILAVAALMAAGTVRPCAWTLSVMWESENNRDVRARLAVAEERLRFGRDLHDVMGRNLAVIALKSELAVQLAHRGRPEAIDQMTEVQRIARESQREVREVVRGYRDAELGAELAGAHGVLSAAGIRCEVTGSAAGLPLAVHSALAWVVRECTTNVLRHSEAAHCEIALSRRGDRVLLAIENDGLLPERQSSTGGTGLKGLRERLASVDGTLTCEAAGGRFRVLASVTAPRLAAEDPQHAPADRGDERQPE